MLLLLSSLGVYEMPRGKRDLCNTRPTILKSFCQQRNAQIFAGRHRDVMSCRDPWRIAQLHAHYDEQFAHLTEYAIRYAEGILRVQGAQAPAPVPSSTAPAAARPPRTKKPRGSKGLPSPSQLLTYQKRCAIKPLSDVATKVLTDWYEHHKHHPYPSSDDTQELASQGGVTTGQVRKWFANRRLREGTVLPRSVVAKSRAALRDVNGRRH